MKHWKIDDSQELYNIDGWGIGYYGINEKGNVFVEPKRNGVKIDLKDIVDDLQLRDLSFPVILRFPDIIDDRIETIQTCFKKAAKEYKFKGNFYNVYPIKVNQVRPVVEEIVRHGTKYNIGLEAGSKPELHAVLAIIDDPKAMIICNGYKDADFIELALLAKKMGRRIFLVVEKLNELRQIIKISKKLNVEPNIGIRIKLSAAGSGKWEESGGDQSKFGLNASELLEAIQIIKDNKMEKNFNLIHFHIGSQVTKIRKIKNAFREAAQFYVQIRKSGCNVEYTDVGGGLGVDYDGTRSSSQSSINYTIQEYLNDAVFMFQDAAEKNDLPHPNLVTESGRFLTAHHSVLIFNVLETTNIPEFDFDGELSEDNHELVIELNKIYNKLNKKNMMEFWHDSLQIRDEVLELFNLGLIDLKTRAMMERLFYSIVKEVQLLSKDLKFVPDEMRKVSKILADKYFCNFSLFQSLPDSWAIDQIFPILPLHRLNEKPERMATLQDITCDSDGKIENFIGENQISNIINLHKINEDESYFLGAFLVGAYQEILGDMHNLFGDTNAVHISIKEEGYEIDQIIYGETVAEVLEYVQYNAKQLVKSMELIVTASVKAGQISMKEGKEFLSNYRSGLYGYTYLE